MLKMRVSAGDWIAQQHNQFHIRQECMQYLDIAQWQAQIAWTLFKHVRWMVLFALVHSKASGEIINKEGITKRLCIWALEKVGLKKKKETKRLSE